MKLNTIKKGIWDSTFFKFLLFFSMSSLKEFRYIEENRKYWQNSKNKTLKTQFFVCIGKFLEIPRNVTIFQGNFEFTALFSTIASRSSVQFSINCMHAFFNCTREIHPTSWIHLKMTNKELNTYVLHQFFEMFFWDFTIFPDFFYICASLLFAHTNFLKRCSIESI